MALAFRQPTARNAREDGVALGYVCVRSDDAEVASGARDQTEAIERACASRELSLADVLRDVQPAEGDGSGTRALDEVVRRLANGDCGTLVVAELAALGGSAARLAGVLGWCEDNGVRLIAQDLELDTATQASRVAVRALIAAGALEHAKLGESTRRGLAEARRRGPVGGRPRVADRPELVARILELREQGWTLKAIADQLNADGVPTLRGGKEWRPSSVQAAAGYTRPARARRRNGLPGGDAPLDDAA